MPEQLELRVANLDCDHDAAAISRGLQETSGVVTVDVYPRAGKVRVGFDASTTSTEAVRTKLASLGFPAREGGDNVGPTPVWRNPKVVTASVSGLLLSGGWGISLSVSGWALPFYGAMVIGGYYFVREALEELVYEHQVGIELLMAIAAVSATALGAPGEGAMLVFLYSISEAAEGYTEARTRSAVRALMDLTPKVAIVRRDQGEVELPVEALTIGDVFLLKPGQSVATDGEVIEGTSTVNQAPVTGESVPVAKAPGDTLFAGSINEEGALAVRVTKAFADNTISRIVHMVEEAQERKGATHRFVDRFGQRYSPAVLATAIALAVVPYVLGLESADRWLERAVVFLVAAAPCALVISIPITMVAALGTGARHGVLVKGGLYMEELARIRVVALDKTGTITAGKPSVTEARRLQADVTIDEASLWAVAAGVERHSQHPLATAIVRFVEVKGIRPAEATAFRSITGAGATAVWDGREVAVGSPDLFTVKLGTSVSPELMLDIERLQSTGNTVVLIGSKGAVWGWFAIRDNVRPGAKVAIESLRRIGIKRIAMLTGDNARTASAIAAEVGLDEIYADLKPEDKLTKIRELRKDYGHVAMVGDGVNDAPALAEANVGVAMGAAGTDVALETADVALMADDLERLSYALTLAQSAQRLTRQNLALSIGVISVLVVGALIGSFSLPIAVLGHELSEFLVIANGLRILRA
jgi:Cd2+/Zn2+-exporting ATPase